MSGNRGKMKDPYAPSASVFLHSCAHTSERPQDSWPGLWFSLNLTGVFITACEQRFRAMISHLVARQEDTLEVTNWTDFMDPLGKPGAGNRRGRSEGPRAALLGIKARGDGRAFSVCL